LVSEKTLFGAVAQGTIEYLVAVGVVITFGLFAVFLLGFFLSGGSSVGDSTLRVQRLASGITLKDVLVDSSGEGLVRFGNNTGDYLTVTRVLFSGDNNYNAFLANGEEESFFLTDTNGCSCSGRRTVVCSMTLYYTSSNSVVKREIVDVLVSCVSDVSSSGANVPTSGSEEPLGITPPSIYLLSPVDDLNQASSVVDFNFYLSDSADVSRCQLNVNGVGDTNKTSLVSGVNSIVKTFSSDLFFDWNVSCFTTDSNRHDSNATWQFDVDSNAYQVTSCIELQDMNGNLAGTYVLMNDINCYGSSSWNSGSGFRPIGYDGARFTGKLNGNSRKIKGLYINRSQQYVGLFGYSQTASFSNIGFEDGNITNTNTGSSYVGSLSGYDYNSIISGSYNSNYVNSFGNYIGGLLGYFRFSSATDLNNSGTISMTNASLSGEAGGIVGGIRDNNLVNCYNSGAIISNSKAGGIASGSQNAGIINSHNSGTISSYTNTGGILGGGTGFIKNSYNTGNVTCSNDSCGGILGGGTGEKVSYSYNTGAINGRDNVGGIVGYNYSDINAVFSSYNLGNVSGRQYVGGIAGYTYSASIFNSYNSGNITGTVGYVGGITGYQENVNRNTLLMNCYNTATISSPYIFGGLVGQMNNYAAVINSYNSGEVIGGTEQAGGIVGYISNSSTITNSYSTGSVYGTSSTNGLVGISIIYTSTNVHWYDSNALDAATACGANNCTTLTDTNYSLLFNSSYDVYDLNTPYWGFGVDANWTARDGNYPILSWQS
jgi:hypothetical protein